MSRLKAEWNRLKWLRVYVLLDRKCFVIQDWVEALDKHADSFEEKMIRQNVRKFW